MPLVLSLTQTLTIPVEVDSVRLDVVRAQTVDQIRATPVQNGNRQVPLGEFFSVSGSAAEDATIVWQGDCSRVKRIGARLDGGTIRVEGNAGMHVGAEMTSGEIVVTGSVGDWCGAEMHGGRITVHGNAGHLAGAVYRGGRRGMTAGEILIHGDAGNEVGHTMRRGLIAVGGKSGDAPGFGMIAGSILLFGSPGIRPGAGMRRGTIGLFAGEAAPDMLPTFRLACRYEPVFLRLILQRLRSRGFPIPEGAGNAAYDRWCGDLLELGKGEILIRRS